MKKRFWILAAVIALFVGGAAWYVNDFYHSEVSPAQYQGGTVRVEEGKQGIVLDGEGEDTALIFYPGAKVEYTAYLPLLYELAEQGIDCFLVKMPCNLAFLGMDRADEIIKNSGYAHYYMAGHSLGGAMAAAYAAEHTDVLEGLILLAAYPTKTLDVDGFSVLSVYGSEDGVLNREKLEEGRALMPDSYTELCIEGGNHAQFGDYGVQDGDHAAAITKEEQWKQTVKAVMEMVKEQ